MILGVGLLCHLPIHPYDGFKEQYQKTGRQTGHGTASKSPLVFSRTDHHPDVGFACQPRACDTDPISTPQSISNSRIYTGRQECRWIRGKYVHSVELGTNGSNRGAKHRPPRATIVVSPPKIDEPDVTFRDKLLCYNRSYPQVHSPTLSLSITVVIES